MLAVLRNLARQLDRCVNAPLPRRQLVSRRLRWRSEASHPCFQCMQPLRGRARRARHEGRSFLVTPDGATTRRFADKASGKESILLRKVSIRRCICILEEHVVQANLISHRGGLCCWSSPWTSDAEVELHHELTAIRVDEERTWRSMIMQVWHASVDSRSVHRRGS